jgi:hypothetical protein
LVHGVDLLNHNELTTAALAHKRSLGERVSRHVPFGYRLAADGVHLEADAREAEIVTLAAELRASGLSLRKIGVELVARGYQPRVGSVWHATSVAALLSGSYGSLSTNELTRESLAVKKARGERLGRVPFGWKVADDGTHLVPDADEQFVLVRIRALRTEGLAFQRIVDLLNSTVPAPEAKHGGRQGARWHLATVHRLAKAGKLKPLDLAAMQATAEQCEDE